MNKGSGYRLKSRLLHRFNLHHTRRYGPIGEGEYLHRCEWCGMTRKEIPMWLTERRMREARAGALQGVGRRMSDTPPPGFGISEKRGEKGRRGS